MVETLEKLSKAELINTHLSLHSKHHDMLLEKESLLHEKDFTIIKLKAELKQLQRLIHGVKSERFTSPQCAHPGVLELDLNVERLPEEPTVKETILYERKKKRERNIVHVGRTPIPAGIERIEEIILPEGDLSGCSKIGEEVTEMLEYRPGKLFVRRIVRPKYALPGKKGVVIGALPSLPIEKGIAGASLLSWIIIEKFIYHLPLHRLIQKMQRAGMKISPSTVSDWVRQSSGVLELLFEWFRREVFKQTYLQVDETPIPVLDKDKQGATHQGYYWVYHCPEKKMVLFDYREGRGRIGPSEMLKDFTGFLQTDGYAAYESFDSKRITLIHCMAHARRYFEQALDNDRERGEYALIQIQKLYEVERICREGSYSHEQREMLRKEKSLPILMAMKQWLKTNQLHVLPKSLIGKAINYSLERWDKLSVYAQNGRLEIDNNLVENQIRPVAIGRRNYLFAGSHDAARRHAMLYSFIGTCKLRGIDAENWLCNVLSRIQDHKVNKLHEFFD